MQGVDDEIEVCHRHCQEEPCEVTDDVVYAQTVRMKSKLIRPSSAAGSQEAKNQRDFDRKEDGMPKLPAKIEWLIGSNNLLNDHVDNDNRPHKHDANLPPRPGHGARADG